MNQQLIRQVSQNHRGNISRTTRPHRRARRCPETSQEQAVIGNHGALRNVGTPVMQPNLVLNRPGDKYEREADRVAKQVVHMATCPGQQPIQCLNAEDEQQKADAPTLDPRIETAIQNAQRSGQPLDDNVCGLMDQAFGADFSQVRVHTNREADALNRFLNARAFTTGQDIFFKAGEYNPASASGQKLIAHELTHVVQQNGAVAQQNSAPRRALRVQKATGPRIQRQSVDITGIKITNISDPEIAGLYNILAGLDLVIKSRQNNILKAVEIHEERQNARHVTLALMDLESQRRDKMISDMTLRNNRAIKSQAEETRSFIGDTWGISIGKVNDILINSNRTRVKTDKIFEGQQRTIAMIERIFKKVFPFSSPRQTDLGVISEQDDRG